MVEDKIKQKIELILAWICPICGKEIKIKTKANRVKIHYEYKNMNSKSCEHIFMVQTYFKLENIEKSPEQEKYKKSSLIKKIIDRLVDFIVRNLTNLVIFSVIIMNWIQYIYS